MKNSSSTLRRIAWSSLAALATLGCADLPSTRDVRATILDEHDEPIPGATFYVEAADDSGAFAYLWARAGLAGEVPDSAREPLKLPWRRGARLAMAAFAPGRRPAVVVERGSRIRSDGAVLTLDPGPAWTPELEELGYPFPAHSELAAKLADSSDAPLRKVFDEAWNARPPGAVSPGKERNSAAETQ